MPRYTAHIANLMVKGEDRTNFPDGSWIRNRTTFQLSGYELVLLRTRESFPFRPSQMNGKFVHTHDLVVEDVAMGEVRRVERIVRDFTELLTFGTQSHVVNFGHTYNGTSQQRAVRGVALYFRPVFTEGDEIRGFVTQTWSTYRRLRVRRNLHIVFDYLATVDTGQPLEVKLLIMSAVLESLKSTYAAMTGYKYHKPAWRRISVPPQPLHLEPKLWFEPLLREMFRRVHMRPRLRRLIQLRNDIVHNGVSLRPYESQFRSCDNAQALVREYLLRLLGFRGHYYAYNRVMRRLR